MNPFPNPSSRFRPRPMLGAALLLLLNGCFWQGETRFLETDTGLSTTVQGATTAPDADSSAATAVALGFPIVFVTQVPIPNDFATIGSTFAHHEATLQQVGRGGDLWIRYPDGRLKNLTKAAGYGHDGFQGSQSIAVRDPAVHWDAKKVVFSMAIGAPERQYRVESYRWQLYEITGLGPKETPVITHVANQPAEYNNIQPVYASDDRILFTSDRPRGGADHHYPQLDEYESTPTVSGIWSLDPATGDLFELTHAPSGDFHPIIDSFGRVVFTRWDHMQRDQQADADVSGYGTNGTFNWSDESEQAVALADRTEVYPEPRPARQDLLAGTNLNGHRFNHFFPWQVEQDGTGLLTLNHLGRHELQAYFDRSMNDDPNLREFIAGASGRYNPNPLRNFFHVDEDPVRAGRYLGTDAPEFTSHSAGQILALRLPPGANPDEMMVEYLTHPDTRHVSSTPGPDHSGLYREPVSLKDGRLIVVHTAETQRDENIGSRALPRSRYDFRLKLMRKQGSWWVAGRPLTPGIRKQVSWWDPDVLVSYDGLLWEWNPVELRPRPRPRLASEALPDQERKAFARAGVSVEDFRAWLKAQDLALIVTRDVTTRDRADRQQPFNLEVAGGGKQTLGASGKIYEVAHLQIFQADLIRGMGGYQTPRDGRRVLAQPLHDELASFLNLGHQGPEGSVGIAPDGSTAALVPARRAVTWQLTDGQGEGVVRERNWLSFQAGEIRSCASCHGLNTADQSGASEPQNVPQALEDLLQRWKQHRP